MTASARPSNNWFGKSKHRPSNPTYWPPVAHSKFATRSKYRYVRGRTIDLVETVPSEEGAFKGIMAASGCGILMLTIVVLLIGSVVEGFVLPTRRRAFERRLQASEEGTVAPGPSRSIWLRMWPVYPFAIFLALQFLVIVARQKRATAEDGADDLAEPKGKGNPQSNE